MIRRMGVGRPYQGFQTFRLHLLVLRSFQLAIIPNPLKGMGIPARIVKIGFFETNADLLFQNNIHGDLFTQVTQTMDFLLTKYLKAYISYEGVQRIETFPVPEAALREAVFNAITHKDYSNSSPIQISVYRDKLMIWNPGILPNKWTIEKLLSKHASQPYNPQSRQCVFLSWYY